MGIKQDYEQALKLAKQGEYIKARSLLLEHDHPQTKKLLNSINKAILAKHSSKKNKSKPRKLQNILRAIVISFFLVCGILYAIAPYLGTQPLSELDDGVDSDNTNIQNIAPDTSTTQQFSVAPVQPQTAYAAIGARAHECPSSDCEQVVVYQMDELQLIGIAEGDMLESSPIWYFVSRNQREFFVHGNSLTFRGPTPIVPTVDWRIEEQPVYYGPDNSSQFSQPPSSSQWSCRSNTYNCGSFSSCSQMRDYFNSCPGDPSNLDGDNDGIPCERQC